MTESISPPPDGSRRLMITQMVLENFKSYAGVKVIGPFHQCFSAVVGPNGSGKSNVIDAMLFVFGKRAKQLRLAKVSELIHSSQDFPNLTYAKVSVHFCKINDLPNGEYEVIEGTETVVSRMARKDNSSTYQINGKNCQFKDVATYLGGQGIDLDHNRFLILQGEVEMISMMPPIGLLEYLEEIIGSHQFLEETNETGEQMEHLTSVRQEKLNRVKAVEKEKDSLEAAKLEAQALLTKEREIRAKQNILYQLHAQQASNQAEAYAEQKVTVEDKLEQERGRLATADARVAEIQAGLQAQQNDYQQVVQELEQTQQEFASYERKDIKLREDIKHLKGQKKKLQAKVATHTTQQKKAMEQGQEATDSLPALREEIVQREASKQEKDAELEVIFEESKEKTRVLRADLEQATQELAPVSQERAVFQASLDTAETQVQLLQDSTRRATEKLTSAKEELANLDETEQAKHAELQAAQEELATAQARITEATKEDAELEKRESLVGQRNRQLQVRAEESKAALQSNRRNPAVQGILEAAKNGGELYKYGVLGRLGDLCTIAEEYDVAVSTACGSLDHVVVQTTAGVQRCIQFLRKHNLGRANFIPLDKLKKGAHDRVVETPENAPRLFDLIQTKNVALLPAIFLGVSDTLVAPDLETATRWAYESGSKRWRVVTMKGDLIEASGTMSGGGKRVKRGGMKLSNPKAASSNDEDDLDGDYKELQAKADQAQELIKQVRQARKDLTEEIRTLKKRIKQLQVSIPKLEMEISGFDTTRQNLTESIPQLEAQSTMSPADAKKLRELEAKVESCRSDMSSCAARADELEAKVSQLQQAILDAGGSKLKKQQAACEKALKRLDAATKALKTAEVAIVSSEKAVTKAEKAKAAAEEQLKECQESLDQRKTEFKSLEADAVQVHEAYEKVKEVEQEKREALDGVTKECEELLQSQSQVKCVEIELLGKISALDKQIQDASNKAEHWEGELDKLRAAQAEMDDDLSDDEEEEKREQEEADKPIVEEEEEDGTQEDAMEVETTEEVNKNSLPVYSTVTLGKYQKEAVKEEINVLETERNSIAKNANMGAIGEYRKKEADYLARVAELDVVTEERNTVRKKHEELRRMRLDMFMDGFGQITLKLKEMYQMITLGGDAELELVDSLDPFSEGIVFSVRPPKKSWKNISNLSGGEKTLSSLALVFALHHYKPTPLYVMDEIDAALDFKNVSIVANYIKERTKNAQFIIISLRNNMFELADRLVGIYKTNNATKSVTINPKAFGGALTERTNNSSAPSSAAKEVSQGDETATVVEA